MKKKNSYIKTILKLFAGFARAMVSGLPREKLIYEPKANLFLHQKEENIKNEAEKHYHRPVSKPRAEKQTLQKENKK